MSKNKAGLLFVNKTSASKSLSNSKSDSDDLRRINQHVQKSRDLEQERESRKKLKRVKAPVGWAPISVAPEPERPDPSSTLLSPPETPVAGISGLVLLSANHRKVKNDDSLQEIATADEQPTSDTAVDMIRHPRASMEPYGLFRIPMNAEKRAIVQYFALKFFPAVSRLDVAEFMGDAETVNANPAYQIVRNSLTDDLHIMALLAATSARMKYVDHVHFARCDLPEHLATITMRMLRGYLARNQPVTEVLIQSIFFLWAVESYRRNWDAVGTHARMIMHLCNTHMGGFRGLNRHMRRMLWIADRFQAAATSQPPLIDVQWETDQLSIEQYTCGVAALHERGKRPMGQGFNSRSRLFSPAFQMVIDQVLQLSCIVQCHWIGLGTASSIPDRDWAVGRSYSVSVQLLNHQETTTDSQNAIFQRARLLQKCVRLALVDWLAFVPATAAYSPISTNVSAPSIRAAIDARPLRRCLDDLGKRYDEDVGNAQDNALLFWIAGVGVVTSEVPENQEWFAEQFQKYSRKLQIFTWEDFFPINNNYLWLDYIKNGSRARLDWLLQRAVFGDKEIERADE